MKKRIFAFFIAAIMIFSLAGCSPKKAETSQAQPESIQTKKNKHLNVGVNFFPKNVDPADDWNGWHTARYAVGETLVRFNDDMKLEPCLATSWENIDKLTWKIILREGVKFHNGKEMTGEAVKKSIERLVAMNERAAETYLIDSIDAAGQVLTIKTSKPSPAFINDLAEPMCCIVDAEAAASDPEGFKNSPICTGPYKVAKFEADTKASMERHEGYWGGVPKVETVDFLYIADNNTRMLALQSGEIDVAINMASSSLAVFKNNNDYKVSNVSSLRFTYAAFNQKNEWLADENIRKAINMTLDKENYTKVAMNGTGIPAVGPFPTILPFGSERLKGYKYDAEAAKRLLLDAGYKDNDGDGILEKKGKKVEIRLTTYNSRPEMPVIAQSMQADLKKIGIDAKIETYDAIPTEMYNSGNFDIGLSSFATATTGDPYYLLNYAFRTDSTNNYNNYYHNKKIDDLVKTLESEYDLQKRYDIGAEAQQILIDDAQCAFLVYPENYVVCKSIVKGFDAHPIDFYLMNANVDIEK